MLETWRDNFSQNTKFGRFLMQSWLKRGNSKIILNQTVTFIFHSLGYSSAWQIVKMTLIVMIVFLQRNNVVYPVHIKVVLRAATKMKHLPKVLIKKNSLKYKLPYHSLAFLQHPPRRNFLVHLLHWQFELCSHSTVRGQEIN